MGGGENEEDEDENPRFSSCLVPTEVEVEELSDCWEVARIEMEVFWVLVPGSCLKNRVDDKFRAPAMFPPPDSDQRLVSGSWRGWHVICKREMGKSMIN